MIVVACAATGAMVMSGAGLLLRAVTGLMSMANVVIKGHMDGCGLGHHLWSCWSEGHAATRAMLGSTACAATGSLVLL